MVGNQSDATISHLLLKRKLLAEELDKGVFHPFSFEDEMDSVEEQSVSKLY